MAPGIYNFFFKTRFYRQLAKKMMGFAPQRSIPLLQKTTLRSWFKKHKDKKLKQPVAPTKKAV